MSQLPCGRPMPGRSESPRARSLIKKDWRARLAAYLRENDLKQSKSRDRIIEILLGEVWVGDRLGQPWHFSVQELVKKVQAGHPEIGAATVYRNVPVLVACGLIHESLTDEEGRQLYEVAPVPAPRARAPRAGAKDVDGHHDHIVCLDCERIFEFHEEIIESAQEKLSRKMGFKPVDHRHVIYARCSYSRGGKA